jgi:hypothetical protein
MVASWEVAAHDAAREHIAERNMAASHELFVDTIIVGGTGEESDAVHFTMSGQVCSCTGLV